jgi:hypothetical protein
MDAAIRLFPDECIYMRWYYDDPTTTAHKHVMKWYSEKGLKVMASTAASTGSSHILPRENHIQYIKNYSRLVAENHFEGILATAWDDVSPHLETVWRGYIAQGEYGWNPESRDVPTFDKAYAQREFGFRPDENRLAFLENLIVEAGFYSKVMNNLAPPDKSKPGEWSQTNSEKIAKAREIAELHEKTAAGITTAKENTLRNRYTLEIYEESSRLLNHPIRLFLAMSVYDTAQDNAAKNAALKELSQICDDFTTMRSSVESAYSRTRFMENPKGYIAEQNHHHHLAATTQNSDWWFGRESAVVQMVKKWLIE